MTRMISVVGEALVDLVIEPDGQVEAALGGAPFNAARAAARLGADVQFGGALSRDRFGQMLADQLSEDGVDVAGPRTDEPTTLAAAELDASGAAEYRFYFDGTSAPCLHPTDLAPVGTAPSGGPGELRDDHHDVFFTGGLGLVLQPMADTIVQIVADLPATTMVVFDINCRPKIIENRDEYRGRVDEVAARSDIVKVSDDDLAYLLPEVGPIDAARRLLDVGARSVLVTAGSSTTSIVTAAGVVEVPVPALQSPVVDTIGAGDTFGGGLVAWWASAGLGRDDVAPEPLTHAVEAAHAAAAVVVTRRGADPPLRSELDDDWN